MLEKAKSANWVCFPQFHIFCELPAYKTAKLMNGILNVVS